MKIRQRVIVIFLVSALLLSPAYAAVYRIGIEELSACGQSVLIGSDGILYTWGLNDTGQVGDGAEGDSRARPVAIAGVKNPVAVAAGYMHTVAADGSGSVYAWGSNFAGQLGNGGREKSGAPIRVSGLNGVKALAAGMFHSMAVDGSGALYTWGTSLYGELGLGSVGEQLTPAVVGSLSSGVTALSAGMFHSMAIRSGILYTWGMNEYGQLGSGGTDKRDTPGALNLGTAVTYAQAGAYSSFAITNDSKLWAWGRNERGQLGDGTRVNRTAPVRILGVERPVQISCGSTHTLALDSSGDVWAWGDNSYGQLGTGDSTARLTPVKVAFDVPVRYVAAGEYHSLCVDESGEIWVWGDNTYGQFAMSDIDGSPRPLKIEGLSAIKPPEALTQPAEWARESVEALTELGAVPEPLLGRYNYPITRAEFTALIVSVCEYKYRDDLHEGEETFGDTHGHLWEEYILKGYNAGIISGRSPSVFDPDGLITREETAMLLCNVVQVLEGVSARSANALTYGDADSIAPWAKQAVQYARENGIMEGKSAVIFDPKATLTRQEALKAAENLIIKYGWKPAEVPEEVE